MQDSQSHRQRANPSRLSSASKRTNHPQFPHRVGTPVPLHADHARTAQTIQVRVTPPGPEPPRQPSTRRPATDWVVCWSYVLRSRRRRASLRLVHMRTAAAAAIAVFLLLGAACGGTASGKTAGQIADAMKPHLPDVIGVKVWTATDDPSHLLGRPNGYRSCASLTDPVVEGAGGEAGTVAKVEVWPSASAAKQREAYIQGTLVGGAPSALGSEYDYTDGDALLRVNGDQTPAEAQQYAAVFRDAI